MENELTSRPCCKGCGKPAYVICGKFAFCGECAMKLQEVRQKKEEENINKVLGID